MRQLRKMKSLAFTAAFLTRQLRSCRYSAVRFLRSPVKE